MKKDESELKSLEEEYRDLKTTAIMTGTGALATGSTAKYLQHLSQEMWSISEKMINPSLYIVDNYEAVRDLRYLAFQNNHIWLGLTYTAIILGAASIIYTIGWYNIRRKIKRAKKRFEVTK